jgi:hypothetical protein
MEQTPNYKLNKPGYEEFGDVEVLNQNFAAIDTELKKNADAVGERVKTTELAEKVKESVKSGGLTAADLGAVSAKDKGKAGGIAGLGADGKVPSSQLPEMDFDPSGTAADVVKKHNAAGNAHNALFAKKLDKLTGKKGQFAGFTEDNVVGAMDAPNGGETDSGVGELQDTEMEVGTFTNAGAGWNTFKFREAFEGVVLVKDITAEGFLYCLRKLATGSYYTGGSTGTNPSHSATTLVSGTTTTADSIKINYIAVEYGGER